METNCFDLSGCGTVTHSCDGRYNDATIGDCKSRCEATDSCKSFTFAPVDGDEDHPGVTVCTLYTIVWPSNVDKN